MKRLPRTHGTTAMFATGCRCFACRLARATYEANRKARIEAGERVPGDIPADHARRHLRTLSAAGVGKHRVAALADVNALTVLRIATGRRTHIRPETERRILAVSRDDKAMKALVDADLTWKRINDLLALGYTKRELAGRLGYRAPHAGIQLQRDRVTRLNAKRVARLHRTLMDEHARRLPGELGGRHRCQRRGR